jgi:hypothetical protein
MSTKRTVSELLTAYANLSFDAGRWSVDEKTRRRYERAKDRAGVLRERIITLYMKAAYHD